MYKQVAGVAHQHLGATRPRRFLPISSIYTPRIHSHHHGEQHFMHAVASRCPPAVCVSAMRTDRGLRLIAKAVETPSRSPPAPFFSQQRLAILYRRLLRDLSDLKLAIYLMLTIAVLSGVGTVIEQGKDADYYMRAFPDGPDKVLGFLTYQWVLLLQFDHIYTAWYFLGAIALLAASLAACTSTRQLPMVKVANKWKFFTKPRSIAMLAKDGVSELLPKARMSDLGTALTQKGYQVFIKDASLYAFKGLAGKLGPIGVHASMLLVLAGTTWSGIGGWKGSVICPEGQGFVVERAIYPASPVSILPSGARRNVIVNSFSIDYRPDGSPAQFYSDLSVVDDEENELKRQTIFVNKPLRYGGVTYYQTDWEPSSVEMTVAKAGTTQDSPAAIALPFASLEGRPGISGKIWAAFLPTGPPKTENGAPPGITFLVRDLQSVAVYDTRGQFAGVRRPDSGTPLQVEGLTVVVSKLRGASGIEIKNDPGVPLVYLGFAGMMITTLQSYLSHSQVWAVQEGSNLYVGGKANRAKYQFEGEMDGILSSLPELTD